MNQNISISASMSPSIDGAAKAANQGLAGSSSMSPSVDGAATAANQAVTLDECIAIVEQQEALLRFSCFGRKEAWELGRLMVSRVLEENLALSVSIRLISGLTLFQYLPEGTTGNNELWMTRKFNVARDMEVSSLLNLLRLKKRGRSLDDQGLDSRVYAASGGAFPIHVTGAGVIGAALVSGRPHLFDHGFLVESIGRFLNLAGVPAVPLDSRI